MNKEGKFKRKGRERERGEGEGERERERERERTKHPRGTIRVVLAGWQSVAGFRS